MSTDDNGSQRRQRVQFGLASVLGWTTAVAIWLSLVMWLRLDAVSAVCIGLIGGAWKANPSMALRTRFFIAMVLLASVVLRSVF